MAYNTPIKKLLQTALLIMSVGSAMGQIKSITDSRVKNNTADSLYLKFIGQLVTINGNSSASSAVLEISEQPNLKLNIPLYQGFNKSSDSRHAVYIDGKIGAANGYSALIGKGSWKPSTDANISYLLFAPRIIRYYNNEYPDVEDQHKISIASASSINYGWFFVKAGISHSELALYNDSASTNFQNRLTNKLATSANFRLGYSHYWFPSRNYMKPISLLGTIYAEFKTYDNNYSTLTKVDIERKRTFVGANDSLIEATESKLSAAKGKYIAGNSYNLGGELMCIIAPENSQLVIGLAAGISRKFFNEQSYSTASFTLNIPVKRRDASSKETTVNIALKAELPDIYSEHSKEGELDQRTKVGFTIGLPLPNHRR